MFLPGRVEAAHPSPAHHTWWIGTTVAAWSGRLRSVCDIRWIWRLQLVPAGLHGGLSGLVLLALLQQAYHLPACPHVHEIFASPPAITVV